MLVLCCAAFTMVTKAEQEYVGHLFTYFHGNDKQGEADTFRGKPGRLLPGAE